MIGNSLLGVAGDSPATGDCFEGAIVSPVVARAGISGSGPDPCVINTLPFPTGEWYTLKLNLFDVSVEQIRRLYLVPSNQTGFVQISSISLINAATRARLWSACSPPDFEGVSIEGDALRLADVQYLYLMVTGREPRVQLNVAGEIPHCPMEVEFTLRVRRKANVLEEVSRVAIASDIATRLIGIDRLNMSLIANGWRSSRVEDSEVILSCGDQISRTTISAGKRYWSLRFALGKETTPEDMAALSYTPDSGPVQHFTFALSDALDMTPARIFISNMKPDIRRETIEISGWHYSTAKVSGLGVSIRGESETAAQMHIVRKDVCVNYPLIKDTRLGWRIALSVPGIANRLERSDAIVLQFKLYSGKHVVAYMERTINLSEQKRAHAILRRIAARFESAPLRRLEALLCSEAFRKRWADANRPVFTEARRLLVEELISRNAVDHDLAIRLNNGDLVIANPSGDQVIARSFLLDGSYERGFVDFIVSLIRPGDIAIDVGAAYGVVARAMARGGAKVLAIDANPSMTKRLNESLQANAISGVTVIEKAVADHSGFVSFASLDKVNPSASKIVSDGSSEARDQLIDEINSLTIIPLEYNYAGDRPTGSLAAADIETRPIEATTLDELCEQYGLSDVRVVKMDIEGAEWLALQGARELCTGRFGPPPIVALEFSKIVRLLGGTHDNIFEYFHDMDWKIYVQEGTKSRGGKLKLIPNLAEAPNHDNIICVPPGCILPEDLFV